MKPTSPSPAADYRARLLQEIASRRGRNPAYSLRAFARDLKISKTALSDALGKKRHLSRQALERVAERLALAPSERDSWTRQATGKGTFEYQQIDEDRFQALSSWYCVAILLLPKLKAHRANPVWIARRLGISPLEAANALEVLTRLGMIQVIKNRVVRTSAPFSFAPGRASAAVRSYHKQNLELASRTIEAVSVDQRVFSSISLTLERNKLQEAEKMINAFKEKLASKFASSSGDEVYTLAIQLFPVTQTPRKDPVP